jgi:hypothetical protein
MTTALAIELAIQEAVALRVTVSVAEEIDGDGNVSAFPCRQEWWNRLAADDASWSRRIYLVGDAHADGTFRTEW